MNTVNFLYPVTSRKRTGTPFVTHCGFPPRQTWRKITGLPAHRRLTRLCLLGTPPWGSLVSSWDFARMNFEEIQAPPLVWFLFQMLMGKWSSVPRFYFLWGLYTDTQISLCLHTYIEVCVFPCLLSGPLLLWLRPNVKEGKEDWQRTEVST